MQRQPDWQQFVMDLGSLEPQLVEELFNRHGAQAVTLLDAGDEPLLEPGPGETPMWKDMRISGLFSADVGMDALRNDIVSSFGLKSLPKNRVEELAERDWEREWLKDFKPMRFGENLWICPGDSDIGSAEAVVVRLDPGLAFGTGTHATTALCLEWLDRLRLAGDAVLDFGCGSGILSIAAVMLGAKSATAFDIDPQAIRATDNNAARNSVADRVYATTDDARVAGYFDVVVANILAQPLIGNAQRICEHVRPGGHIALSGILTHQADDVKEAFDKWIRFDPTVIKDDWVLVGGTRT